MENPGPESHGAQPADRLVRTLSEDGGLGVRAIDATRLVAEAAQRHRTSALTTQALGRVLMGAILVAAGGKDGETVQLRFRGSGPLGTLLAVADTEARVRGYPSAPQAGAEGGLSVAQGVGLGDLAVVRHRPGWRQPYTGIVPIVSGEIAEDLALYLTESEQTPSAVGLGVQLDAQGQVLAAAGFLAHVLPEADEEALDRLEFNVRALPSPSDVVRAGEGAEGIAARLLAGMGGRELETRPAHFQCHCDEERVVRAVALLGREDLQDLELRGDTLEVHCEFCRERYEIEPAAVRAQLA